ncbi:MAG: hypothetical protein HRT45_11615 [Bdellovibrionales bacterium]|nr:hypothetical protein [Bdellovibrionales bacterium]
MTKKSIAIIASFVAIGLAFSGCATSKTDKKTDTQIQQASDDFQTEVNQAETALEEDNEILQSLPEGTSFEDLEEEFANVNQDQLKQDIMLIQDQIIETEQELQDAQSLLSSMIEKDQPSSAIETQKSRVVVLEDQLFELNDEKTLKEIEIEVTR